MTAVILDAAQAINQKPGPWQGFADMDSFYVLIASLLLAFVAFIILMRLRW
jgi:TctA family transporter